MATRAHFKLKFLPSLVGLLVTVTSHSAWSQNDSVSDNSKANLAFSGFLDSYAASDFNDPFTETRPYTTQALYDEEIRVNLAMLDSKLATDDVRGRIAIQAGDSVKSNYAGEDDRFWRYVQESTVGVKLSDRLWLDGGIYFAHVGFETFNSRDNWNYTRSLVAEFSPYYETGGKLTYQVADSVTLQTHLVRGWQNISSSAEPMYGLQLNYTPDSATQFTYANLLGHQFGGYRTFHDFIVRRDITEDWSVAAQFDFGTQGREDDDRGSWHGWALLTRYKVAPQWSIGGRVERYYDPHQVIVTTLSGEEFNVTGLSVNIDYEIQKGLFWRTEYRALFGNTDIFPRDREENFSASDSFVVTSLSYSFEVGGLT